MLNIFDISQLVQPLFITKIIILIVLFFYIIFTIVIYNQVKTMNNLINISTASIIIEALSVLHILAAISLFVLAIAIL